MFRQISLTGMLIIFTTLTACSLNEVDTPADPAAEAGSLQAEAFRDAVFVVREGERETLALVQQTSLTVGEGLAVDEDGRATLRLNELLTVELLQASEVTLQTVEDKSEAVEIALKQSDGLLFGEFNPERRDDHRLTVQTERAAVSTTGGRLIVTRGVDNLEWIVNLGPADDVLEVTTAAGTLAIPGGAARWAAQDGTLSESLAIDTGAVDTWFDIIRSGAGQSSLSEVILPPADMVANLTRLTVLPRVGQSFELGSDASQGVVRVTLDPVGLFGAPTYTLQDCNGDGNQDLAVLAGKIHFDFSPVLAQVNALDVAVINRDLPGNGALWASSAGDDEIARQLFEVGGGSSQTLSLRSNQPYQAAQLAMVDGCFIGFSLTPPTSAGTPAPPRAVISPSQPQSSTVVNVLAQAETASGPETGAQPGQREATQIDAWPLDPDEDIAVEIDGSSSDWNELTRQNRAAWSQFSIITYNQACANRFPGAEGADDLNGQVLFAYDEQFLYVAFQVDDDGFVGYSGNKQEYFLGDSPQLSLDMELLGDYDDTDRSQDDWQVDFYPQPNAPLAVLWQLGSLSSRDFEEASVAAATTGSGYFVEAALPWRSLGAAPQPGDRLGLAANVNDNDTPGTNAQECIISTAPQREWNDPTTWGTLFLRPSG